MAPLYFTVVLPSGQVGSHGVPVNMDWPSMSLGDSPPTVVPGATGANEVCFETAGERGTFTLRYDDQFYDERDATWTFDVQ
jgi:hypothetical protein